MRPITHLTEEAFTRATEAAKDEPGVTSGFFGINPKRNRVDVFIVRDKKTGEPLEIHVLMESGQ